MFSVEQSGKAQITDTGWSAEIVIPRAALDNVPVEPGTEWGFNIVRNDLQPVSIWKDVGPVFNTPSQFGRLVIGSYDSWWKAAWEDGVKGRFESISGEMKEKKELLILPSKDLAE